MGSKSLVICDPEEKYAQALAFYIMNRKEIHFQVQVCSEIWHIQEADFLLISDFYSEEERESVNARKKFILSENGNCDPEKGVIFKYQTGEQILDEIIRCCEEIYSVNEVFFSSAQKKKGKVIAIFSPIHRIGKTAYALQLGEEMAFSENVLYLSLELYGGIGGHFEKGGHHEP